MNTGKYAAYKQLTTPKSDLSDVIVKQEELQNQFEEKQELKAEKKKKEQKARTEDIGKINSGPRTQYLNLEHTFMDGFKKQGGIIEVYSNASARYAKDPTDTEAYGIMQNIEKGVGQIGLAKKAIIAYDKLMSEGIANKTIDPNRNRKFRSVLEGLKKGEIKLNVDKYGVITIENLAIDRDKDGKLDVITPESLSDKNAWGDWQGLFNLNTYNTKMKKEFGTKREKGKDPSGKTFDTIDKKGFDEANTLLVRDRYKQTFGKDSDNLTSDGVSILYQQGFDLEKKPITEVEYQSFLDAKVEEFKQMYDSSELKESGVRSRLAIQNAKSNASKNEEKIPDFYAMTDSTTKQALKTTYEGKEYTSFAIEKAIKFIAGKDEVEVSEFYINEDNEVIFSGRKKVKSTLKTITETKKDESKKTVEKDGKDRWTKVNNNRLNQIEANLLAVNLGYSNTGELVKAARKKVSGLTSRRTEVNRSEIPSLAAKYGHKSVEEYTRLLIEKGIKIID